MVETNHDWLWDVLHDMQNYAKAHELNKFSFALERSVQALELELSGFTLNCDQN